MRKHFISTLLYSIMLVVNYFASNTDILGSSLMNIAKIFPFSYMPPGRVFGIARGSIYLTLGIRIIRGRVQYKNSTKNITTLENAAPRFWASCAFNMLRLVLTGQEKYIAAYVIICALLYTLYRIMKIITWSPRHTEDHSRKIVGPSALDENISKITFGLYYGRVSLATSVVGISQVIYLINPELALSDGRTGLVIGFGIAFTIRSFLTFRNRAQLAIAIAAFLGIGISLFG